MMNSACLSLCLSFWFSFSSWAIWRTEGSGFWYLGPRFLGERASSVPLSAWRRQVVRLDEYSPSRRRRAPICPDSLQDSACRNIRRLYSAVYFRRTGFSRTSGFETAPCPWWLNGAVIKGIPVALRILSISSIVTFALVNMSSFFSITIFSFPPSIIESKLQGGKCLTYIGTEGSASAPFARLALVPMQRICSGA